MRACPLLSMQLQYRTMLQLDHEQIMHGDYFQPRKVPSLLEFNLSADFRRLKRLQVRVFQCFH
jgi:hypothetical protein